MTWVIQMGSGEMMRAMGDIMVKHGQKLRGATKCLRKTQRAEAPSKPQRKARIPMQTFLRSLAIAVALAAGTAFALPHHAAAASAAELNRDSQAALKQLYATNPGAKDLGKKTVAILVFPAVVKAGLGVGGQFGEGSCTGAARQPPTTTTREGRSGCKPVLRNTATRCSF